MDNNKFLIVDGPCTSPLRFTGTLEDARAKADTMVSSAVRYVIIANEKGAEICRRDFVLRGFRWAGEIPTGAIRVTDGFYSPWNTGHAGDPVR